MLYGVYLSEKSPSRRLCFVANDSGISQQRQRRRVIPRLRWAFETETQLTSMFLVFPQPRDRKF